MQSAIVGLSKNEKKGIIKIVMITPISGAEATKSRVVHMKIKESIFSGWIKNESTPATSPKKSIMLPFPLRASEFLTNFFSVIPKQSLMIALPILLFIIAEETESLEKSSGSEDKTIIVPIIR